MFVKVTQVIFLTLLRTQAPTNEGNGQACRLASALCEELVRSSENEERILGHLSEHPNDSQVRILRILVLLQSGESATAASELERLRASGDTAADCTTFLEDEIAFRTRLSEFKTEFTEALETRSASTLRSAVEDLDLPEVDKAVLRVYSDVYGGRFDVALARLQAEVMAPKAEEFDLSFDEIKKVSQKVEFVGVSNRHTRTEYAVKLSRQGVFLRVEPNGQVGTLALFNDFTQVFGEAAARRVMYNFGAYILHVFDDERVTKRSLLVEAPKEGGFWLNLARVANGQRVEVKLTDDFERKVQDANTEWRGKLQGQMERLTEGVFDALESSHLAAINALLECPLPSDRH